MPSEIIHWFPGHMAKTKRIMGECLSEVDIVLEILDARIPESSANPDIAKLTKGKPLLKLLNKASLADPVASKLWAAHYRRGGASCLTIDCITGEGFSSVPATVREILSEKVERYREKGMSGRHLKAMVVGIPNVGKSSFINKMAGGKKARVENRPGVTVQKQWVPAFDGLDLLDMPGVLWPKFESQETGLVLAATGAVKESILDLENVAYRLLLLLSEHYQEALMTRYKLKEEVLPLLKTPENLEVIGRARGFLLSGGVIDTERAAKTLVDEFKRGILGRITLEWPKEG